MHKDKKGVPFVHPNLKGAPFPFSHPLPKTTVLSEERTDHLGQIRALKEQVGELKEALILLGKAHQINLRAFEILRIEGFNIEGAIDRIGSALDQAHREAEARERNDR